MLEAKASMAEASKPSNPRSRQTGNMVKSFFENRR